ATTPWKYKDITGLSLTEHDVTITATPGSETGYLALLGVEPLLPESHRVKVTNAGLSGSAAQEWLPDTSFTRPFNTVAGMFTGWQGAIVQLGTNNTDAATTLDSIRSIVQKLND